MDDAAQLIGVNVAGFIRRSSSLNAPAGYCVIHNGQKITHALKS